MRVREARPEDNAALIALELASPLVLGTERAVYDRSPDFFSRHRLQREHRVMVADLGGEIVGVAAAALHTPLIERRPHRLAYINHARVRADVQRRGVAGAFSAALLAWAKEHGAEGSYWFIAPANVDSIAFGGRGGGRWPADITFRRIDVSRADAATAAPLEPGRLDEAVGLINATHEGQDLFEPLTAASMAARLRNDPAQYGIEHLRGVVAGGRLVAVAGLWDAGACMEEVRTDTRSGEVTRSRTASVLDWGWVPGEEHAIRDLLTALASEARSLGRTALTLSEGAPGALPGIALPSSGFALSLFTPTLPPPAASPRGVFVDLVYL
ncbi:MAG: GNAT family N-acetyltransferase [Dehalococcoidia bacterium]